MKLALFACGLLCSSACLARTPFQIRCEDSIGKAVYVLNSSQNGYSIDHSRPFRSLTTFKGKAPAGSYVLGLTRTESRVSIGLGGPMLVDPKSGYECIAPKITVSLYYVPIIIYIGSEFPRGSCAYKEILAHEMRHLNTYLDHLPKVETVVRAAMSKRFNDKPLYAPGGQAQRLLKQEIDTSWMPFIKSEMLKVEKEQARIDTPGEYARLSKVCKGEVQSFIRRGR
jgi:hypothetical protein